MVDLVLEHASRIPLDLEPNIPVVQVQRFNRNGIEAGHLSHPARDAETALKPELAALGLDDLRVDQRQGEPRVILFLVSLWDMDHDQATGNADLRRGQADSGRVKHRFVHVLSQLPEAVVHMPDLRRLLSEAWIALQHDIKDGHRFPVSLGRRSRLLRAPRIFLRVSPKETLYLNMHAGRIESCQDEMLTRHRLVTTMCLRAGDP